MNTLIKIVTGVLLTAVLTVGGFAAKETYANSLQLATLEQVVKDYKETQVRIENKIDWLIDLAVLGNS